MKTIVKGLTALLICGTFIFANCDSAEAAEVTDLNTNTVQTQDLARHHYPPPPPPPHWDRHPHHPPHHRPGPHHPPPPPHWDRHPHGPHHPPPPPPHRHRW